MSETRGRSARCLPAECPPLIVEWEGDRLWVTSPDGVSYRVHDVLWTSMEENPETFIDPGSDPRADHRRFITTTGEDFMCSLTKRDVTDLSSATLLEQLAAAIRFNRRPRPGENVGAYLDDLRAVDGTRRAGRGGRTAVVGGLDRRDANVDVRRHATGVRRSPLIADDTVYLAYFDESGDAGLVNSPTKFFVLACVLVHETQWTETLDGLINMRRVLRDNHNISTRQEIKSTDLRRGKGPLRGLGTSLTERMRIYRWIMRYHLTNLPHARVFAVAVNKRPSASKGWEPRETAWRFALQRVTRFCEEDDERAAIFPDEGHGDLIRRLIRRMRRFNQVPSRFGGNSLAVTTERLVEDPSDRQSHDSYMVQMADLFAYAAHRSKYIDPNPGVPGNLWDELGACRVLKVNGLTGGPPGIKVHP